MNKKTKTYALLIAVLAIWGTIAYKILSASNQSSTIPEQQKILSSFNPKVKEVDSFAINMVERDPFLGTFPKNKKSSTKGNISRKKDTILIPKMVYLGLLKKKESTNQIFVININNEQFLVKKGQEVQDVKIINGDSKKMLVKFNKRTITLPIQ